MAQTLEELRARFARTSAGRRAPSNALDALPEAIATRLSPSLAERLSRLRPRHPNPLPSRPSEADAARELSGHLIAPGLVHVVRKHPTPMPHGVDRLRDPTTLRWRNPAFVALRDRRIALIDTETTGLAGGTGTVPFVVGLASIAARSVVLEQWILLTFAAEAAMLDALAQRLATFSAIVTYNGKSFDAPLLQARQRLHARADCIAALEHVDLLPWTRAHRPVTWLDARLQTVEQGWLGLSRQDDIAGADVPAAWRGWLDRGATRDLARVVRHNRLDILSLGALLQRVIEYQPDDLLKEPDARMRAPARRGALPSLA